MQRNFGVGSPLEQKTKEESRVDEVKVINKLDDEMTDAYRADDPLTGNIIETDLRKKFKDAKDKYGEVDHISKRTSEITGNPPRKHLDRSEVVKKKRN